MNSSIFPLNQTDKAALSQMPRPSKFRLFVGWVLLFMTILSVAICLRVSTTNLKALSGKANPTHIKSTDIVNITGSGRNRAVYVFIEGRQHAVPHIGGRFRPVVGVSVRFTYERGRLQFLTPAGRLIKPHDAIFFVFASFTMVIVVLFLIPAMFGLRTAAERAAGLGGPPTA
jgi:hypothetical protein